ncbi:MAG: carboxymuconolactone decarboxylase family protein [Candidatus Humimicrobiaceae bacterium]
MENNTQKILSEIDENFMDIEGISPDYFKAFKNFMGEAVKEGALSLKTKELITVALSVASNCTYCIALHVKKSR